MTYGSAAITPVGASQESSRSATTVVVCGSFRRDPDRLRRECRLLVRAGCRILSPVDIDWVAERDGFVLAANEIDGDPGEIEQTHLSAMRSAHLVWLHAPDGYVGHSAAMELGYAHALGLAVFTRELPQDVTLARLATKVDSVDNALEHLQTESATPALGLNSLQHYYRRAAEARGWADEDAQACLGFLTEEFGELFRAIREDGESSHAAALEMADIQLYLTHLANITKIDLGQAVVDKERINAARFRPVAGRAAA